MENNLIEKYELIDGIVIIDSEYNIVTANEEMYRFMGFNINKSMIEVIHQVDADDFVDVCTSLQKGQFKNMVLRMRRNDNSYRWMLMGISRDTIVNQKHTLEYWRIEISDIIAMKKMNSSLQNSVMDFQHVMAMENELFFTYDFESGKFRVSNFIDNEITKLFELPIEQVRTASIDRGYIAEESKDDFFAFCKDVEEGNVSFAYHLRADFLKQGHGFNDFIFKGSCIYSQMKPRKVVGSIRTVNASKDNYNIKTYEYNNELALMSYHDVRSFSEKNIKYNPECNLTLILMQIDRYDEYEKTYGTDFTESLEDVTIQTTKQMLGYRGIICKIKTNLYSIAIKDLCNETSVRAFIQSLRTKIAWNYQMKDMRTSITFSIGIARYPENGTDLSQIHRKMVRGLQIAEERGGDRYIIYREYLHGDIS